MRHFILLTFIAAVGAQAERPAPHELKLGDGTAKLRLVCKETGPDQLVCRSIRLELKHPKPPKAPKPAVTAAKARRQQPVLCALRQYYSSGGLVDAADKVCACKSDDCLLAAVEEYQDKAEAVCELDVLFFRGFEFVKGPGGYRARLPDLLCEVDEQWTLALEGERWVLSMEPSEQSTRCSNKASQRYEEEKGMLEDVTNCRGGLSF